MNPSSTSFESATSAERVRRYLVEEFSRPEVKEGSRLPTARQLSSQLGVSSATVSQVFRELSREGILKTRVGSGTYLLGRPKDVSGTTKRWTVALNCPIPSNKSEAPWTYNVIQGILRAATRGGRRVTVLPLSDQTEAGVSAVEVLKEEAAYVDGLIFVPGYLISHAERDSLLDLYAQAGKAWITVHPPKVTSTTNFISTDYYGICRKLGAAWYGTGRRRIALIDSLVHSEDYPVMLYRLWGLQAGLQEAGSPSMAVEMLKIMSGDEAGAYKEFCEFLKSGAEVPDAIVCNGDYQALGLLRALNEAGISVPERTSLVGISGLPLESTHCPGLTSFVQPFEELGEELVAMLVKRMQDPAAERGGKYLPLGLRGGATTRPEENSLLGLSPAAA